MLTRYWLFKTDPETFSIDDLARAEKKTAGWDGVRNYQARNLLRDEVKKGDRVLVYHSSAESIGVAGTAVVTRAGHPDPTAFEKGHHHFDPKSDPAKPAWFQVGVKHAQTFKRVVTREALAADPATRGMGVLKRGNRLSIQPVSEAEFLAVLRLGNA